MNEHLERAGLSRFLSAGSRRAHAGDALKTRELLLSPLDSSEGPEPRSRCRGGGGASTEAKLRDRYDAAKWPLIELQDVCAQRLSEAKCSSECRCRGYINFYTSQRDALAAQMNGHFHLSGRSLPLRPSAGQKHFVPEKKPHIFFGLQQSEFGRVGVEAGVTRQQI